MRVLVTNDDGVRAVGIGVLARALADEGHDVIIVAPIDEASGAGAGVGPIHLFRDGLNVEKIELEGLEEVETLAIDALPALAVIAGCMGAFGPPPELVVAGINAGRNLGRTVLHSGTVGAALTAANFGRHGMAVSIQTGGPSPIHYETAAAIACALVRSIGDSPARTVINCNVPNLAQEKLRGLRLAHLSRSGLIRAALVDGGGPSVQLDLGLADNLDDGSDEALSNDGFATLTPLLGVREDTSGAGEAVVDDLIAAWTARSGSDNENDRRLAI